MLPMAGRENRKLSNYFIRRYSLFSELTEKKRLYKSVFLDAVYKLDNSLTLNSKFICLARLTLVVSTLTFGEHAAFQIANCVK
jgi:hypothetical protein